MAVQRLLVLSQTLANHPALQQGVEPEIVVDLQATEKTCCLTKKGITDRLKVMWQQSVKDKTTLMMFIQVKCVLLGKVPAETLIPSL